MPVSKIVFVVPDAADGIARALCFNYAILEGMESTESEEDVAAHLAARAGKVASVEFDDDEDPLEGVHDLAKELERAKADHFGVTPAFEERSRGMRVEGKVYFGLDGEAVRKDFPWRGGDPELDERTLRAVGIDEAQVSRVAETFFSATPAPRY